MTPQNINWDNNETKKEGKCGNSLKPKADVVIRNVGADACETEK